MSRTSCGDGWCDQSSGYMIERNNCQDQVAEHSPGLSSVKSAVSGFYVLRFPYFQSYGGFKPILCQSRSADAVAQCWHPQQVVAGRRRGRVRDQLTANGDRAELPSASRTRRKAAPPRPEPAVTAVTMFCSELWQHTGHGQTPPVRVSSQLF